MNRKWINLLQTRCEVFPNRLMSHTYRQKKCCCRYPHTLGRTVCVERHKGRNVDPIRKYPALAPYCATARRLRTRYINLSPLKDIPSSRDLDRTFRLLRARVRASRVRDCLEQDLGRDPCGRSTRRWAR